MSTQTALGHSFPTPCKRCGGALYRQVDYCPYCGAVHPLEESMYKRTPFPGSRPGAMSPPARQFGDAQALPDEADATAHAVHPDEAVPPDTARRTSRLPAHTHAPLPPYDDNAPYPPRDTAAAFRRVLLAIAAVVVIGLAFVGYALFSDYNDSEDIVGERTASATHDATTTTGTIAPFSPAQSNHPTAAVKPSTPATVARVAPAAPAATVAPPVAAPSVATRSVTTPPVVAAPVVAAPVVAAPVVAAPVVAPPVVAPPAVAPPIVATPVKPALQFRDATQALQSARLAFRANNLSAAQAALGAALALQPGGRDAQDLAAELRPLTTRRDSALQAAQTCIAQQSWSCARAHANEALTIDTGNDTAKGILERVIRETGWAPLNPHAGAAVPAQGKPPGQAQTATATQQAQIQTPLPQGMPANSELSAAAPRAGATGTAGGATSSLDARERAIKDSGWTRAPSNGGKASASVPSSQ
ncbi:hypothetical protein [Paraburkholderia ginsengisoli]|uniref:Zinc ribbon domain-containing protein n=1 Tax=Paraburkholderia ginsengisoli TaxID=311231 RepID=A0A7T4N912_9BURK|nr:hypothetical protein [Paraburkholderia ginsengisoli]QQC67450.1 hypothetical protein I6I06_21220 [Paraburkholderia ginsengisoli]